MSSCPNKSLPEWIALENALGSAAQALLAYTLNGNDIIPTVSEAKELLKNAQEFEENHTKSPEFKQKALDRVDGQINSLKRIHDASPMDARRNTINALIENLKQYRKLIEEDSKTVSVSKLIGGGELKNAENYKDYSNFGSFIHYIVEKLLEETTATGSSSIVKFYNKKKLKEYFKEFIANPKQNFKILGLVEDDKILNEDELFNMTNDIVSVLQHYTSNGYTVLPEISITSLDKHNRNVVGRIDISVIDNTGKIEILDIKTKKVESDTSSNKLKTYYDVTPSNLTDSEFTGGKRNAYENWDIQLGVYSNMLKSIGIDTKEKRVIILQYFGTSIATDIETLDGSYLTEWSYDFYKVDGYISSELNKTDENDYIKYINHMRKVDIVIPTGKTNEKIASENRDNFIFNMTKEEADVLLRNLETTVDIQLRSAYEKKNEIKRQETTEGGISEENNKILKYWDDRIETLNKIKESLKTDSWETPYKVSFIIKNLLYDTEALVQTIASLGEVVTEKDIINRAKDLDDLNKTAVGFKNFVNDLRSHLQSSGIKINDPIMKVISEIESNIRNVSAQYNNMGFKFLVSLLKNSMTEDQLEKLDKNRKEAIEAIITQKKRKLENIKNNTPEFFERIGSIWYKGTSAASNVARSATGQDLILKSEVEQLEREIAVLEVKLAGVKMTDQGVKEYIEAILDPTSISYIGEGTTYFTDYIASASSSDWVLSSFTNKLKIAIAQANQKTVNFIEKEKIQKEFDDFKGSSTSMSELNEQISEVRNELSFDENGGEKITQIRSFVIPFSEAYYQRFDRYRNKMEQFRKKLNNTTDPDLRDQLKKEKALIEEEHRNWQMSNSQMPLVKEVYELEKMLPVDYKEERNALYKEKNILENSAGYNNAEQLDESTLDRIYEIEIELKKLKNKYIEKNADSQKYFDLMEKFYDYEINYNYYNRLLNQKIVEYTNDNGVIDWDAVNKWKTENTIKRPSEEWHSQVSAIWDQIFAILGKQDPELTELQQKYRVIINQYKRQGIVDSRFFSQDDIQTIEEIETLMESIKSEKGKYDLDIDDRTALSELYRQMDEIRMVVDNPFYRETFTNKYSEVEKSWFLYKQETDAKKKEFYLEQFLIKELEFTDWYNVNHQNKYQSKFQSKEPINPIPKKFNTLSLPVNPDMMVEKPGSKFIKRIYKKEAYNKSYQKDSMGYPLPLNVQKNGVEMIGSSPWFNPKYVSIKSDPRKSKFYHSFVGRYISMQEDTTGARLGYYFPGYEIQSVDDIKTKGVVEAIKNRGRMFKEKNFTVKGIYDFTINEYNSEIEDRIQFKHNKPLPINQQTDDGISAVLRWYEQAFINIAAAEVQPVSAAMISYVESLYESLSDSQFPGKVERMQKLRRTIDSMIFEYDKFVKGESKKDEGLAGRFGDKLLGAIGFTRLALDVPNQIGNMLSGNVQAFLGQSKSMHYGAENYLWAKKKIYAYDDGLIASLMKDVSKFGDRTFMTKMFLYWNPLQKELDHYYNRTRTKGDRLVQGMADLNFTFWLQDKGEIEISSTIWLSIMDNVKVKVIKSRNEDGSVKEYEKDENGNIKTISAFDVYTENENGEIVYKDNVEWSKEKEDAVMKTVWAEYRRTQGNYATFDKSKAEKGITGRFLVYYRKYLVDGIRNRFGRLEERTEDAIMAQGFYNALLQAFKSYGVINVFKSVVGVKDTGVSDFYSTKSRMAMREMAVAAMTYMISRMLIAALKAEGGDDDKDKTVARWAQLQAIAIFSKVELETRSMVPLPVIGGTTSYLQNFGSFTNANRDLIKMASLLEHAGAVGFAQFTDSEAIQNAAYYQKKSGYYEKGDPKFLKDLYDLTGWGNITELVNPGPRVENTFIKRR